MPSPGNTLKRGPYAPKETKPGRIGTTRGVVQFESANISRSWELMHYRAVWLVDFGFFFGSIFGRETLGHWITFIAAIAMLVGIFGDVARKTKLGRSELPNIPSEGKHEQTH